VLLLLYGIQIALKFTRDLRLSVKYEEDLGLNDESKNPLKVKRAKRRENYTSHYFRFLVNTCDKIEICTISYRTVRTRLLGFHVLMVKVRTLGWMSAYA
jgi:hypothetical protein